MPAGYPWPIVHEETDQIGDQLLGARERAGLTVDDVVFQTRISRDVIVALEEGDFTVFSSPAYAKSFLAQYSSLLNVDASIWIEALEPGAFSLGESPHLLSVPAAREWMEKHPVRKSNSGWIAAVGLLTISCLLVFAAFKGYEFLESKFADKPDSSEKPAAVAPAKPVEATPPKAPVGEAVEKPAPPRKDERKPAPRATVVRDGD